jgi:hypothetical protein
MTLVTKTPNRIFTKENAIIFHSKVSSSNYSNETESSDDTGAFIEYIMFYTALENNSILTKDPSGDFYSVQNPDIQNARNTHEANTSFMYNKPTFDINKKDRIKMNLDDLVNRTIFKENLYRANGYSEYLKNKEKKE